MEKHPFRFKRKLLSINGIYNIPGLMICSGYGYAFKTFCCKRCGEIYVADLEALHHQKSDLYTILKGRACLVCNNDLGTGLADYPENIFLQGAIHKNISAKDDSNNEETEVLNFYVLN